MTPRQARVALGAFVLLAAGVTGNALYLQSPIDRAAEKPDPAAPRADSERQAGPPAEPAPVGKTPHRTAAALPEQPNGEPKSEAKSARTLKVRMVRVATIAETPVEDTDPDTVRAVQTELNRLGHGPVAADGVMRPELRAAIMAYEHEHHLPLTGEASQALLKRLLFGAPATPAAVSPPEVRSPHAQAMIRQVQRILAERGYRPGAVDGRLGAETVAAIRTFEVDQGLVPKGRISAILLDRLESGMAGGGRHKNP